MTAGTSTKFVPVVILFALLTVGMLFADTWEYVRSGILSGEVWRILTGQFVHVNTTHLVLNFVCATTILYLYFGRRGMMMDLMAMIAFSFLYGFMNK